MNNKSILRLKSIDELNYELLNLLKEYFSLRVKLSTNQLKQTHLVRVCRKNIAIMKTILWEKKNNGK